MIIGTKRAKAKTFALFCFVLFQRNMDKFHRQFSCDNKPTRLGASQLETYLYSHP